MATEINTGKILKLIETDNVYKVPFHAGQYIIVDDGMVYYDPTTGVSTENRICITPKCEVDVYVRDANRSDDYYLALHTDPIIGDLVIIKDLIPNTNNYSHTVYIYNNNEEDTNINEWCKLTNVNSAENIYLSNDIALNAKTLLNNRVIKCAGKNLEEVLYEIFSPELNPNVVTPTVELSFPEAGAYEIGSIVTPTYSMTLNPGEYEYGPATNVVATSFIAASSDDTIINNQSGTFPDIIIDESTNFYMSASIVYSDGSVPVTNKNNEYPAGMINAGSATVESSHITGYLNGLYYGCSQDIKTKENITSEFIRTLNKSKKSYEALNTDLLVPAGTKSIIIACPKTEAGLGRIYNHTAGCDMLMAFGTPIELAIKVNDYSQIYNVWIYSPAEAYENNANITITTL